VNRRPEREFTCSLVRSRPTGWWRRSVGSWA